MPIDYKRYPKNWFSELRPTVLSRAGNCCENCGLQNGSFVWSVPFHIRVPETGRYKQRSIWFRHEEDAKREGSFRIKKVKVVLTIAHLDHDEENHEVTVERLRALCQVCHLRYDAREKYIRSLKKW